MTHSYHSNPQNSRLVDDTQLPLVTPKIPGWSMTHSIKLIRDPHDKEKTKSSPHLGDILKEKASQGVQVLVSNQNVLNI